MRLSSKIEAELIGDLKDGGKLSFHVVGAKPSAPIKPLTIAQSFGNALAPGASVRVDVILDFGAEW